MKRKTGLSVFLALAVALLTALVPVAGLAEGNKTYFTGEECEVASLDPGVWTELGNGKFRVEGVQVLFWDQTSDPRTTGDAYVTFSAVLDLNTGSGPMWGTWEIVNDQGSWFGHVVGRLDNWVSSAHGVAHGSGAYAGLVGYWNYNRPGPWACFTIAGYVVETGGGE